MPFDESTISDIVPSRVGDRLAISWDSTAPAGSAYQVYLDRNLAWSGMATACRVPMPRSRVAITVGAVLFSEVDTDFSASIAPAHATRAVLAWQGGGYLSTNASHFDVYGSAVAGGPVSYAKSLASIPVYDAGIATDGFGTGGFGAGGFGSSSSGYTWTSDPLLPGVWSYAVITVDDSGHTSIAATATVTIAGPPSPPAANDAGQRLTYVYDPSTQLVTLNWLPSPG